MTPKQKLQLEQSEKRQWINELLAADTLTDEERSELDGLTKRMQQIEVELRAAIVAEPDPVTSPASDDTARDRLELRSRASVGRYLLAAMPGRSIDGAERELLDEAGLDDGTIPLELWDTNPIEQRADTVSGAPSTVGVNLDRLRPAVFAPSILPRLGVEMPRVKSGTYASGTITTSLAAASQAKGDAAEASATAFTVTSVTPKRITARLAIAIEDVAAVGQANFESVLRENLSLVLSDELDKQGLNGAGGNSGKDLVGVFHPSRQSDRSDRRGDLRQLRGCVRGSRGWAVGVNCEGHRGGVRTGHLSAVCEDVPRRHGPGPGRYGLLRLRDGPLWGLVDEQADARRGWLVEGSAGHPVPQGPVDDGRLGWDAHCGVSALEHDLDR